MKRIILASRSPRRRDILSDIGLKFEVMDSEFDEGAIRFEGEPERLVESLAYGKAKNIADRMINSVVLGADTLVVLDGKIYGKPANSQDAFDMLSSLSGKTHQVITGVAMIDKYASRVLVSHEVTKVTFNRLKEEEILAYIKSGDYIGKAGAYGIQGRGAILVNKIEGSYLNVVGLPLSKVCSMLKSLDEYVYTHWD